MKIPLASDERISEFPQKTLTLFITFIAADDDWFSVNLRLLFIIFI